MWLILVQVWYIFITYGPGDSSEVFWVNLKQLVKEGSFHERFIQQLLNWTHRVQVFEDRIDNIVGVAYAMDLLDLVQKVR